MQRIGSLFQGNCLNLVQNNPHQPPCTQGIYKKWMLQDPWQKKPIPFSVEYTIKNCTIYLKYYLNHVGVICIFTWKSLSYTTCRKPLFDQHVSRAMKMFHRFLLLLSMIWIYIWQRNFKPTGNTMNVLSLLHFDDIFFKGLKEI